MNFYLCQLHGQYQPGGLADTGCPKCNRSGTSSYMPRTAISLPTSDRAKYEALVDKYCALADKYVELSELYANSLLAALAATERKGE